MNSKEEQELSIRQISRKRSFKVGLDCWFKIIQLLNVMADNMEGLRQHGEIQALKNKLFKEERYKSLISKFELIRALSILKNITGALTECKEGLRLVKPEAAEIQQVVKIQSNITRIKKILQEYSETVGYHHKPGEEFSHVWNIDKNHSWMLEIRNHVVEQTSQPLCRPEELNKVAEATTRMEEAIKGHVKVIDINLEAVQDTTEQEHHSFFVKTQEELLEHEHIFEFRNFVFGALKDETLYAKSRVAEIKYMAGKYNEASEDYVNLINISTSMFGKHCKETLTYRHSVAKIWVAQGKCQEALLEHTEILQIKTQQLSHDHPEVLNTTFEIARCLYVLQRYEESLETHQKILEIRRNKLPEKHPVILSSLHEIAKVMHKLEKSQQAIQQHMSVLAEREMMFGRRHTHTLESMHEIGVTLYETGEHQRALTYLHDVLDLRGKLLGHHHPETIATLQFYAETLGAVSVISEDHGKRLLIHAHSLNEQQLQQLQTVRKVATRIKLNKQTCKTQIYRTVSNGSYFGKYL